MQRGICRKHARIVGLDPKGVAQRVLKLAGSEAYHATQRRTDLTARQRRLRFALDITTTKLAAKRRARGERFFAAACQPQ